MAAAAFRLPDALKVRDGMGKWLLRRWLEQHCPAARPFARKQGFTVPVGAWIARRRAGSGRWSRASPGWPRSPSRAACAPCSAHADGRRQGQRPGTLLFYALWHRAHVQGVRAGRGDVFEALAVR